MRYLSQLKNKNLSGKICLLRVDFNIENERETFRLYSSLPTIKFLLARGIKVVLLSHRGRPAKPDKKNSLKAVTPFLRSHLEKSIAFCPTFNFSKIKKLIQKSPPRSVFLLENMRFLEAEEHNGASLARKLATLGDFYVNDAFSVSHRLNASVTQLPKFLPSYAGLLLEKEITNLNRILKSQARPAVIILGGVKVRDKIGVIENFLPRVDHFLVGGVLANTFLKASGFDIDKSTFGADSLELAKKLLRSKKIVIPIDFVTQNKNILDIGPLTVGLFKNKLKSARTIFWNGPLGVFEKKKFARGSAEIARFISRSRAFSVIGGGETTRLIHNLKLEKRIGFLSTGGGAMLEYLSGKKLPGIQALK